MSVTIPSWMALTDLNADGKIGGLSYHILPPINGSQIDEISTWTEKLGDTGWLSGWSIGDAIVKDGMDIDLGFHQIEIKPVPKAFRPKIDDIIRVYVKNIFDFHVNQGSLNAKVKEFRQWCRDNRVRFNVGLDISIFPLNTDSATDPDILSRLFYLEFEGVQAATLFKLAFL